MSGIFRPAGDESTPKYFLAAPQPKVLPYPERATELCSNISIHQTRRIEIFRFLEPQ
jgi:hypothetical protein